MLGASAWVVISILVSQIGAALYQERSEEHQEEEEPVKHSVLGGQRAPQDHWHQRGTERKRPDGPIPGLGGCQHSEVLSAHSVQVLIHPCGGQRRSPDGRDPRTNGTSATSPTQ